MEVNNLQNQVLALNSGEDIIKVFFGFLADYDITYDPKLKKALDTSHTETDQQLMLNADQVTFSGENFQQPFKNEHMVIFAIRAQEGDASNAAANQQFYVPGIGDPLIQNGRGSIDINGTIKMRNIPFLDFTRAEEEPFSGWIILPNPIVWIAETTLTWQTLFPNATAVANSALALQLRGWKLVS